MTIALAAASSAIAEKAPVFAEGKAVKDRPVVTIDPAKGYVLLSGDAPVSLYLTKLPSDADRTKWSALRAEKLAKERRKYQSRERSYQQALRTRSAGGSGATTALPDKPVEPTDATFEYTPFATMAGVAIGPMDRFAKTPGGGSTYLTELTPGRYRIYGPMIVAPTGAGAGTCFCMGSVEFAVKGGEIVDLGIRSTRTLPPVARVAGDAAAPHLDETAPFLVPRGAGVGADPRLALIKVVPATFKIAGKSPNYYGITVGRMPPMPGVFHYVADQMVAETGR